MTKVDMDELRENLAQCRRCGICRNAVYEEMGFDGVCPVWKNSSGFETSFMRGRIQVAQALLDGRLERSAENVESLYTCTLCGNCTQICAAEFDPAKTLMQVRQVLNDVPNEARDEVIRKILENLNPYESDNSIRRDWTKELGFDVAPKGSVVYYVGCTAGLRLPSIAISTAKILKTLGNDFAVLEEESCCGSVMMRTGMMDSAKEMAGKLAQAFKEAGAEKIVVSCAGCLNTLRNDYPKHFGIDLPEVVHIAEYAAEMIKKGELQPKGSTERIRVTYHDPCHLGREQGIYDAPREVLCAIPGLELVEMETIREAALCCGAGGGLRSYDSELAKRIASDRIRTALNTGATIIATACPFCVNNLIEGTKKVEKPIQVADVVDLLAKYL
ncbi:MAG: (Fe-S)-binding protein [Candidatus Thorarchaeota archaeon]|nr:(Fe-S)-binding protein [Candidatus Thorarchaeota archaeon]